MAWRAAGGPRPARLCHGTGAPTSHLHPHILRSGSGPIPSPRLLPCRHLALIIYNAFTKKSATPGAEPSRLGLGRKHSPRRSSNPYQASAEILKRWSEEPV